VFLELIHKLKASICELEFALSTKRVTCLIGTEESCPMIVEIYSYLIHGQRVAPPNPRPSGWESRQEFDFFGWESTPEAKKGKKGQRVWGSGRERE